MAFFQKKPAVSSSAPAYTIGATKTLLLMGLGNPGKEYAGTRHNVGYEVIEEFARANDFPGWVAKKDLQAEITLRVLGESRVVLAKPSTFMNNSGQAASAIQRFYRVYNSQTVAVYDELAITFGQIRARVGGSDAGHNGVRSLIEHIGDDFGRLRIGVGNDHNARANNAKFVLAKFTKEEQASLAQVIREAGAMLTEYIFSNELPHDTRQAL